MGSPTHATPPDTTTDMTTEAGGAPSPDATAARDRSGPERGGDPVATGTGSLEEQVSALADVDMADRPDAFAALDAAIVAELRSIEDL